MDAQLLDAASGAYMLGCALFDAGKLPQAEWVFFEGRRFAEHDYRFPAKLAAVRYEIGSYASAIFFIQRALSLLDPHSHEPIRQELYIAMARACLLSSNVEKARTAISHITSEHNRRQFEKSLLHIEAMATMSSPPTTTTNGSDSHSQGLTFQPDKKTLWRKVIERLPKCRPGLADEVEFIPVCSERVRSLFNSSSVDPNQENYSFLFTNTGDARDVFATLSDIGYMVSQNLFPSAKKFYFTLVDLKPITFARDLLMFRMLADWVTESDTKRRVTEAALAYTFASQIMPSWVYDRLKSAIRCVSDELNTDVSLIMGRFCIDTATRGLISSHYRNWQDPLQHPFTTGQILSITGNQLAERDMTTSSNTNIPPRPCEPDSPDSLSFKNLNFMLPPLPVLEENERGLLELAGRFGYMPNCPPIGKILLERYVESYWWPNVTLLDFD
ncbi:uncharacterized protein F4807DRAFT_468391 [Annulohypoxylon truncatum]|uniref:uncharacterized protein n=1 Tax=Annulohypoxylon truncatum TaxID=327061 RepID=UPI002007A0BE|nr:uncharacterized protein F4807DRAFT_468391 [Annulohypoxylon truncatum]KAI1208760.1 hypothetical protein F4807DRAFT_468391 [Annulohypoxylon truncatum]